MILVGDCCEEAVHCFSRLSELDPNSSHAHFGLGIKASQDKKYEDAIKSISLGEFINTIENLQMFSDLLQYGWRLSKFFKLLDKNVSD